MTTNGRDGQRRQLTVLAADDSFLVREALERMLTGSPGVRLVGTYADGDALLAAVEQHEPDVVVTDMRMPPSGDEEGLRVSSRLREERPDVGVVILTQHDEPRYGRAMVTGGASRRAYLLKDRVDSRRAIISAIELVAHGGSVIDPYIVEGMLSAPGSSAAGSALATLTPRERDVLALMAEGRSNAAIAHELVLTRHAVEKYVSAIFEKLGLDDEQETSRRVVAVLRYLEAVTP
jgi:DNA-binding NarL/FixJ family response regulator